ncbi:hypothetical protein Ddye_013315 [Dipteronia dyeriana]|uniref:RNase H type-1 domain-containing protein n=1 Tax=Dipteronia dyeriana TaxID=168575 RepID=A0AAD9X630_9ROSI|nr:hypothetical protein Ddye_013315 [Dipteronia dyeriana]
MINHTLLCLIPKVKRVERMKELRPISMCNVIFKCISKAPANRLRKRCFDPQVVEAKAILRGLRLALETGLCPVVLELDAL